MMKNAATATLYIAAYGVLFGMVVAADLNTTSGWVLITTAVVGALVTACTTKID